MDKRSPQFDSRLMHGNLHFHGAIYLKALSRYTGLCFWGIFFAGLLLYSLWPLLVDFTHVTDGDTIWWYGSYHYFFENILQGVLPFWNPYGTGGSPYYFLYSMYRLLDPLMVIPVIIAKLTDANLLHLYYQFMTFREFVFLIGVGVLMRYLMRSNRIVVLLAFLFLAIHSFELFSMFKRDSEMWAPWFFFSVLKAYHEDSKPWIWACGYLFGIILGAGSYHFAFLTTFSISFLFFYSLRHFREVREYVIRHWRTLAGATTLTVLLSLPLLAIHLDRQGIFPVTRAYGSRDHFIEEYRRTGNFDIKAPFEDVFVKPSVFNGNYYRIAQFKADYLRVSSPSHGYFLFLLLFFILFINKSGKWPLILSVGLLYYFSMAELPGHRFLYEHVFPFTNIRHTAGFSNLTEIPILIMMGFAVCGLSMDRYIRHPRFLRFAILPLVGIFLYQFPRMRPWQWPLISIGMAIAFLPKSYRRVVVPLCLVVAMGYKYGNYVKYYKSCLRPYEEIVRKPNDIYAPLDKLGFRPQTIQFRATRQFALPRPAYLLSEDLLLKENIALNSVLEAPDGTSSEHITFLSLWKDPTLSNRSIYWPARYLDTYLLGEKNLMAFLDLMGVERPIIQLFPEENVEVRTHGQQIQLFENFDYSTHPDNFRLTDNTLYLEGGSTQKASLPIGSGSFGTFNVSKFDTNSIQIKTQTARSGYLLYRDHWDPHWRVYIDGNESQLLKANIGFKAVALPNGHHVVEFRYFPRFFAFTIGLFIAINFGAFLLGSYFLTFRVCNLMFSSWPHPVTIRPEALN